MLPGQVGQYSQPIPEDVFGPFEEDPTLPSMALGKV